MDFTLSDDERAVTEAAAQVAGAADPWGALEEGGWLDILLEDERGLAYLGLVAEALGRGAVGAMVHRLPEGVAADARLVAVDDTMDALTALGRYGRLRSRAKVIAVTGSVGKTSTKEALSRALGAAGTTHASLGNLNNQWGVPLSLARLPAQADFGVFELGMNQPGEIAPLSALAVTKIAAEVLEENSAPPIFNLILGPVEDVAERMVRDSRFPLISATGSVAMGRRELLRRQAGGRLEQAVEMRGAQPRAARQPLETGRFLRRLDEPAGRRHHRRAPPGRPVPTWPGSRAAWTDPRTTRRESRPVSGPLRYQEEPVPGSACPWRCRWCWRRGTCISRP